MYSTWYIRDNVLERLYVYDSQIMYLKLFVYIYLSF